MEEQQTVSQPALGKQLLAKLRTFPSDQVPDENANKERIKRLLSNTAGPEDVDAAKSFIGV